MDNSMIRFPSIFNRRKRSMGPRLVECQVSTRWLEFPESSIGTFRDGEYIAVSVMTLGSDEEPKKLCDLILTREGLSAALGAVMKTVK